MRSTHHRRECDLHNGCSSVQHPASSAQEANPPIKKLKGGARFGAAAAQVLESLAHRCVRETLRWWDSLDGCCKLQTEKSLWFEIGTHTHARIYLNASADRIKEL